MNKCALFVQRYEVWDFMEDLPFLSRRSVAASCTKTFGPQGEVTKLLTLFLWQFL
jgi:hypothetical protein